ncbi:MAG: DEAD/DEAH box helicase, partial [Clostridium sp.]|nr:DEAD/DEAH box helicase [Clostridium sp.]
METIRFEELNCSEEIKKAVREMGFEEATPIQSMAIPAVLEGRDVVGQAQTGTGKTAAFGIPTIDMVNEDLNAIQTLVLCPTRELAVQISQEFKKLAKYKKNIRVLAVYGGESMEMQIR